VQSQACCGLERGHGGREAALVAVADAVDDEYRLVHAFSSVGEGSGHYPVVT
jgi:hypothetical protein